MSNTRVIITAEDQTGEGINSVKTSMAGLGATIGVFAAATQVAIGAIGEMAQQTIGLWKEQVNLADSMDEMSVRMAMSIKDLTYWKTAAEMNGATLESMAAGTRMLSKHMVEHGAALRQAGIDTKDTNKAFLQLSDLFAGMTDPVARLDLATKLFGRGIGQQLLPTLVMGSKALLEIKEATDGYGAALEKLSPEAQKANDRLTLIGVNFKQAATEGVYPLVKAVNEDLLPTFERFSKDGTLADWSKSVVMATAHVMDELTLLKFLLVEVSIPFERIGKNIETVGALGAIAAKGSLDEKKQAYAALKAENQAFFADLDARKLANKLPTDLYAARARRLFEKGDYSGNGMLPPVANTDAAAATLESGVHSRKAATKSDLFSSLLKGIDERTSSLAAEAESTDRLSESQKFALKLMTDLQGGYLKLNDSQKVTLTTRLETLLAVDQENQKTEALRKTMLEQAKAAEQAAEAQRKVLAALEDKATAAEFELQTYGMTRAQIESTTIARLEERRAMYAGLDGHEKELEALEQEIAARMRLRDALHGIDEKEAAKKAIDDQAKEWKRFTDEVDRSLTDALMRGFENGKDGGKAFVDSIKNSLKTAAFKIAVQAVVNPVMGAAGSLLGVSGAGGGGFGGAGGFGGGGIGDLFSMGSSANSLLGGSSAYTAFALSETGASLGLSTAYIDALGIGEAVGGTALSALGTALPYLGAALAVGSMLGLFDGGGEDPHNNTSATGFELGLAKSGVFAVQNSDATGAPSMMSAGPTSGEGWWADSANLSAAQIAAINQQIAVTFAQGRAMAQMFGVDPSVIDSATVDSRRDGTPSNGHIQGYFSSMEQAFAALGESIAVKIIPNLNEFQASGESLAQTAARITQEFVLTNKMAALMGKDAATAFGSNNLKARDSLIQSLGGVGGATSVFDSYYRNFHSDRERTADMRGSIESTLRAIGIADVPATREQFRSLVEGQNLATEAGRTMYATLLSVSDAFAGITASADEAARALGTERFKTRADYLFAQKTGIMPAYADGGDHGGGWAIVGERGSELAYMPPAHVYSNRDSKALLDMSQVTQAIDALRADLRAVNAAMVRVSSKTAKVLERWDGDGMPAERVLV
ncbi:MAG: hypothetical protein HYY97_15820 [Rhodocyclales bacterium]|nr:hypothetical protein [Rhodocyclales bacterium]